MGTRYNHLSLEEGCRLRGLMEMGLPKAEIARRLGRHRRRAERAGAKGAPHHYADGPSVGYILTNHLEFSDGAPQLQ